MQFKKQKADHFRLKKLQVKALGSLFVHKCQVRMLNESRQVAKEMRRDYSMRMQKDAFLSLKNHWKAEQFKLQKQSELVQACLYQWSVTLKLQKIERRYQI